MLTFSMREMLPRLLLALACGAVIGLNRDLHRKSAGFRTFGLVSVGSAIVALLVIQMSPDPNAVSRVTGLTTAAAVWLAAGLGLACGLGQFPLALAGLAIALVILIIGKPVERLFEKLFLLEHGEPPGDIRDPKDLDG